MHELSLMSNLLETVEEQARAAGARRVLAVQLLVGERSGCVEDSLRFAFELLAAGRSCAGARLEIRRAPMRFRCPACAADYAPAEGQFRCPACQSVGRLLDDGSALLVESMEIET